MIKLMDKDVYPKIVECTKVDLYWEWEEIPSMVKVYEDGTKETFKFVKGVKTDPCGAYIRVDGRLISKEEFEALVEYERLEQETHDICDRFKKERLEKEKFRIFHKNSLEVTILSEKYKKRLDEIDKLQDKIYFLADFDKYPIPGENIMLVFMRTQKTIYASLEGIPLIIKRSKHYRYAPSYGRHSHFSKGVSNEKIKYDPIIIFYDTYPPREYKSIRNWQYFTPDAKQITKKEFNALVKEYQEGIKSGKIKNEIKIDVEY